MKQDPKSVAEQIFSPDHKAAIQDALQRVLASAPFAGSPRLKAFLSYVVEETLEGRGDDIRGKSVAVDVYSRKLKGDAGLNLVRVEARRLRRLLTEHYEGDGKDDPVMIVIDPGGYCPRFDFRVAPEPVRDQSPAPPKQSLRLTTPTMLIAAGGLVALIAGSVFLLQPKPAPPPASLQHDPARVALREHSVLSLQAKNIADQARGMLFPIFDLKRQELALGMFQHAIDLDDSLPDGHAGAAQTMTVIGMFTPDHQLARERLQNALASANRALEIAPADPWAHGAMAFVLAALEDYETAITHAQIARDLSPQDGHVLDLVGMAAILANEPMLAAQASDPTSLREGSGRFGSRNIWAVSQLMLGNYPETVEAFKGAAAAGAPVSAPSLLFQAVALDQMSETEQAHTLMSELKKTWPSFPAVFIVDAMFADDSEVEQAVMSLLRNTDF